MYKNIFFHTSVKWNFVHNKRFWIFISTYKELLIRKASDNVIRALTKIPILLHHKIWSTIFKIIKRVPSEIKNR